METVGFIGLGNMGAPVAGHIQKAGFPLVVFDLRDQASRPFRECGARFVNSAAELARRSDVIVTALPMPDDVEQVVRGANGILEGIRAQSIYVDISTNPPALIRRLEPLFRAKGAFVLDAPVASGQPAPPAASTRSWSAATKRSSRAPNRCCGPSAIRFSTPARWAPAASASSSIK